MRWILKTHCVFIAVERPNDCSLLPLSVNSHFEVPILLKDARAYGGDDS